MAKGPAMTPTNRSVLALQADGWLVDIVERHITKLLTRDCFGIADLIAVRPGFHPKLIQVTTGSNVAARVNKILDEPKTIQVLQSGLEIDVHGWRYLKKVEDWRVRVVPITFDLYMDD